MADIEIRYDPDGAIDEVIAGGCFAHLERMTDNSWALILESGESRVNLAIGAKQAKVEAVLVDKG